MDEMNQGSEKEGEFDQEELLKSLFREHRIYFTDDRYRKPTSRYEAWLMASYLSNMQIAKTLQDIFKELKPLLKALDIFQKQPEKTIIKGEENQEVETSLRRRRRK